MSSDTTITEESVADLANPLDIDKQKNDTSSLLRDLEVAIAALPAVDAKRVEEVLSKLRAGQIDILCNEDQTLTSAERIAKKIIDEKL